MFLVLVSLFVKTKFADAFLVATLEMAHESLKEVGIRRFEVIRQESDPKHFILYETFNSRADHEMHLETDHVKHWLGLVKPMLSRPIQRDSYSQLF